MLGFNRINARIIGLLTFILAMLTACHSTSPTGQVAAQAAVMTVLPDESSSTAFLASPTYTDAAVRKVGEMVMQQQLGDAFRVVGFGSRTADRSVDLLSLTSGYGLRLPAVRKRLEARLNDLFAGDRTRGGDGSTNLLYTLEHANLACTPHSTVVILSDGIEASDQYSVATSLSAGAPVHLPPPSGPILRGCKIAFVGIGVAPQNGGAEPETLPNDRLQALTAGWREWFQSAGVASTDMSFQSVL